MNGVDLFSGPGGLTLGLKRAGITPLCAVEKRRDAVETYTGHTPEAEHHCTDIRSIDFTRFAGKADIVYGGPPCQPFSTGGLRQAERDSRNMVPAFLHAVGVIRPTAVLMENVPGLAVAGRSHILELVLDRLTRLGFIPTWHVLNAAHYGVPQNRRRLFIVALRDRAFWFPRPTHGPHGSKPLVPSKTVISLEPYGDPPNCPVVYAKCPDPRPSPYAGHVYNGGGRPVNLEGPCHTVLASAGGYKTHWIDTLGIAVEYNKHLVAGGEPWAGEVPGARRMTVEESALVQTFPRDMQFVGSRSSQFTQVGDAVPPLLAEVLGRAVTEQLAGQEPQPATHYAPQALQGSFL